MTLRPVRAGLAAFLVGSVALFGDPALAQSTPTPEPACAYDTFPATEVAGQIVLYSPSYPPIGIPVCVADKFGTGRSFLSLENNFVVGSLLLGFDTSALADSDDILAADVVLPTEQVGDADGKSFTADWFDWGGVCDETDYSFFSQTSAMSPAGNCGTNCLITNIAPFSSTTFLLDAVSNVNHSGVTRMRFHVADDSQPSGENHVNLGGVPELIVYHCAGPTSTVTVTNTPTPTPRGRSVDPPGGGPPPQIVVCTGDCNSDGMITIDELLRGVNIALGYSADCSAMDTDGTNGVSVNELILAVNNALSFCSTVPRAPLVIRITNNGSVRADGITVHGRMEMPGGKSEGASSYFIPVPTLNPGQTAVLTPPTPLAAGKWIHAIGDPITASGQVSQRTPRPTRTTRCLTTVEQGSVFCKDRCDNDGNGLMDCDDGSCSSGPDAVCPTFTPTPTRTFTHLPTRTGSLGPSKTPTRSFTATRTRTTTPTMPTVTRTPTLTRRPTFTPLPSSTVTRTGTSTATPNPSASATPTMGPPRQFQARKGLVIADPAAATTIEWTVMDVLEVNSTADTSDGTCDNTCTLRDALMKARDEMSGSILIQFSPAVFPHVMDNDADPISMISLTEQLRIESGTVPSTKRIVIDAIDDVGNPSSLDPVEKRSYSRVVKIPSNIDPIDIFGTNIDIIGLGVDRAAASGEIDRDAVRFMNTARDSTLDTMRIRGGTTAGTNQDCVSVEPGSQGNLIKHSDILKCSDAGIRSTGGEITIEDNSIHDTKGDAVTGIGALITAKRNLLELAGGTGVTADQTTLMTDGNIIRNTAAAAIDLKDAFDFTLSNDYTCGSTDGAGLRLDTATGTITGVSSVYNATGIEVLDGSGPTLSFTAFTQNAGAEAFLSASAASSADGQWESCYVNSSNFDTCNEDSIRSFDTQGPFFFLSSTQAHRAATGLSIGTVEPSAAVEGGLVRISGTGFNAIDGYPVANGNCNSPQIENKCGTSNSSLQGTCVEFEVPGKDPDPAIVVAVTPNYIVVKSPIACAQPVQVRVRRQDGTNLSQTGIGDTIDFCRN